MTTPIQQKSPGQRLDQLCLRCLRRC
jgi:hypothetical protein